MNVNAESGAAFFRVPRLVWVGVALACCSASLYLYFAVYWAVSTITEDHVRPGDMPLGDGTGVIPTVLASAGALASLCAAWRGRRLWNRDRSLATAALILGSAIGLLPAALLLLVPASA